VVLILAFLSALVSSFYGYSHSCLCTCIFIVSVNKAIIIWTYMEVVNTCIFVGSSFCWTQLSSCLPSLLLEVQNSCSFLSIALRFKSDMMDKIQVFTVGGRSDCGHTDFDTNVFVWGWRVGDVHASSIVSAEHTSWWTRAVPWIRNLGTEIVSYKRHYKWICAPNRCGSHWMDFHAIL